MDFRGMSVELIRRVLMGWGEHGGFSFREARFIFLCLLIGQILLRVIAKGGDILNCKVRVDKMVRDMSL
jgi:hypothetical protein